MELFTVNDIYNKNNVQEPMKTGTVLDELFSIKKGIMPAGITMIPGKSGIGKTTVCIEIIKTVKLRDNSKKVLFISVEMNKIHLYRYSKRLNFGNIPIFIFDLDNSITEQFIEIISQGWDLIFIDSFQQLVNLMSVYDKISSRQAETNIIRAMDNCRLGDNKLTLNTAFLCTMHMTKSGTFAGSAYIKFMVDAMLELKKDEDNEFLNYMVFTKNRDGKTGIRLYYDVTENGIKFNLGRYKDDINAINEVKELEKEQIKTEIEFDNIFKV